MTCNECGQRLPENARFCSACGRRVAPERIEPVLELEPLESRKQTRRIEQPAPRPPLRTRPAVEPRRLPTTPSYTARLSDTIATWPHAPHAAVALGCVLAIAIHFSSA